MKKVAIVAALLLMFGAWAVASPATSSWDGWISDSKCAAKGADASHAQCTKKCIEGGEKPVLVTDKDQKVVPIENPCSGHWSRRTTCESDGIPYFERRSAH